MGAIGRMKRKLEGGKKYRDNCAKCGEAYRAIPKDKSEAFKKLTPRGYVHASCVNGRWPQRVTN